MMCVFCKIVAGEIPSYKVYEDDKILAFLDIAPVNPGHTLVIPKDHVNNLENVNEETLCLIMKTVKKNGKAIKDGMGAPGYNIIENNDPVAGQIVPHLHFHIIPRNGNDNLKHWPQGKYKEGEAKDVITKIRSKL